jgi:sporulation protein YlmC with PRC-barrel domain
MTETAAPRAEVLRTRDLAGWEVVDRTGEKIGSVADLLIGRDGRVRFVDLEHGFPRKHLLLPQNELEWGDDKFVVGRWTRDQIRSLPPYEPQRPLHGEVLEELERAFPWLYTARGEPEPTKPPAETRIVPLSDAKEFKLGSDAPNLRGWNVFGSDGERLGTATQLLVDPAALKARYLDVKLLDDLFLLKDERHVLVPLERVELKERGNDAWVQGLTARQAARAPAYVGGPVPAWMQTTLEEMYR